MASHALLLCNALMKWLRFGSAASAALAVLIAEGSPTADSCGYAFGAWSSVGGGVVGLGDGVGDGDEDSEGVEPVEWVKFRREGPYACVCVCGCGCGCG
jgi:hypothetical protein